tara:strand:- start:4034 stop:4675 length:642 start_codon:yes stop_codon:yes gene_type:complete
LSIILRTFVAKLNKIAKQDNEMSCPKFARQVRKNKAKLQNLKEMNDREMGDKYFSEVIAEVRSLIFNVNRHIEANTCFVTKSFYKFMAIELQKIMTFQSFSEIKQITNQKDHFFDPSPQDQAKAVEGKYALCLYIDQNMVNVVNKISLKNEGEFNWDSLVSEKLVNDKFYGNGTNRTVLLVDSDPKEKHNIKQLAKVFYKIADSLLENYLELQ